jgi:hypothetical protein
MKKNGNYMKKFSGLCDTNKKIYILESWEFSSADQPNAK